MSSNAAILAELDVKSLELDRAQAMIDHGRKTALGRFPIVRSYLNNRQLELDSQRIRLNAAKTYMQNQNK